MKLLIAAGLMVLCSTALRPASPKAANAWMKTPTREDATDDVNPSIRDRRNLFFDEGIGAASPLTADSAPFFHRSAGASMHGNEEIPRVASRAVLIGTFATFRSRIARSRRAIYTEVIVPVNYVFESSEHLVGPGSTITLALPGGSVETTDGEIICYLVDPEEYFIQPNRTYLFVLSYNPSGDFYSLAKDWDLTTGVVKPNSRGEQVRADRGQSSLVGLSREKLIPFLQIGLANAR